MSWYGRMLWRVREAGLANAAKIMVWYQGESNEDAGYADKFMTLHTAWKQDYPRLQKTYIVQVRPSECNQSPTTSPREEQRQLGNRLSNVEVIAASGLPAHDGCHYENNGYITLGKQLFSLINRDFYKASDTLGISSPNLVNAAWTGAKRDEITLTFASNDALVCGADTSVAGKIRTLANDAFLLDGKPVRAVSVRSEKNVVMVKLANASAAKTISYIPEKCYAASVDAPCVVYEGPWITTKRGVGALTFSNQAMP
jgi:Carbohydrate esterase, sialic acid-specific acetylesterase